jgi:hypothetical protein|tara:strand:- start:200 stop:415 length:216 start_codon:yes stop_codon:yes gene_type:complete
VFTENAELLWLEDKYSEDTLTAKRFLYILISILGTRIILPGLENATREFASITPANKINVSGIKNFALGIL